MADLVALIVELCCPADQLCFEELGCVLRRAVLVFARPAREIAGGLSSTFSWREGKESSSKRTLF